MEIFAARESLCRATIPSLSEIERMALTRRPVAFFRPRSEGGHPLMQVDVQPSIRKARGDEIEVRIRGGGGEVQEAFGSPD